MNTDIPLPAQLSRVLKAAASRGDVTALGRVLDTVEKEFDNARWIDGLKFGHPVFDDICSRYHRSRRAYLGAIRNHLLNHIDELEQAERTVTLTKWYKSRLAHEVAKQRLQVINALGPNSYSARECANASAIEEYAEAIEAMFHARYRERKRLDKVLKDARKSGCITRTVASPSGYRKTGSHVRESDGVRIPVVERE